MSHETKLIEEFDTFSECYDEVVTEHLNYTAHSLIPSMMISYLTADKPLILDLGCGTGISSSLFFEHNYDVIGIDISSGMIQQAEQRPFKKLFCQNLEEPLFFKKEEFHGVVTLGVMEFIEHPERYLQRINAVLKPNGVLGITFPMNKPDLDSELIVKEYNEEQIDALINGAGFKALRKEEFVGYNSAEYTINYTGYILQKT